MNPTLTQIRSCLENRRQAVVDQNRRTVKRYAVQIIEGKPLAMWAHDDICRFAFDLGAMKMTFMEIDEIDCAHHCMMMMQHLTGHDNDAIAAELVQLQKWLGGVRA